MLQSTYRQFHDYILYQEILSVSIPAVRVVQRHWRGFAQRRLFASVVHATIQIQAFARGAILVRRALLGSWRDSSTCIQRIWRGFWVQMHYQMDLLDIVAVQSVVRRRQAINLALRKEKAVQVIQYNTRGYLAKRLLALLRLERSAAILVQVRNHCLCLRQVVILFHLTSRFRPARKLFVDILLLSRLRIGGQYLRLKML